jgi:ribonucleoside-triphosphate reductase
MYLNENPEYAEETAMLIEEMLKQRIQGMKNPKGAYVTPAFPKLLYVLDENNVPKDSRYRYLTDLACRCVAKRMMPDFISAKKMKENYQGQVFGPMGCRSFLCPYVNEKGEYQFYGRFNQGVVTINLVDAALSAGGDINRFWKILDERLKLCYKALMLRHESLLGTTSDVSPIHWQYGAIARLKPGEKIDKLLNSTYSTLSLGYIGLSETVLALLGKNQLSNEGEELSLQIMHRLRKACDDWKAETGLGFSLYGTPAESTTYKFARTLQKRFGTIKDITDHLYITNSYHVNVRQPIGAFEKLAFESQFQDISSGGAISYVEVANMTSNIDAVKTLVDFMYDTIQYAEINTKSDYCQKCGFNGEIVLDDDLNWVCPNCGNKDRRYLNVTRRTCGYLGDNFWNRGRTQEIKERFVHLDNRLHEFK